MSEKNNPAKETSIKINEELKKQLENFSPKYNYPLAEYSTWKIGGPAQILVEANNSFDLEQLIKLGYEYKLPVTILGKISNTLISDEGIRGLVILNRGRGINLLEPSLSVLNSQTIIKAEAETTETIKAIAPRHTESDVSHYDFSDLDYKEGEGLEEVEIKIDSGVDLAYSIAWSLKQGLCGFQHFAGIPGTVGGALFNNIHGGTRHFSDNFINLTALKEVKGSANLVMICGPGGVGKNTIIRSLLKDNPNWIRFTTTTTREPRDYEVEGDDYNFISVEKFQEKLERGEFIEYNELFEGVYYGTDQKLIEQYLSENKTVLFDIDYHGVFNIEKHFGDKVQKIFLLPPTFETLTDRMHNRGDSDAKIQKRLSISKEEMNVASLFDYQVVNDSLEKAISEVNELINLKTRLRKVKLEFKDMDFGYDQSILRAQANNTSDSNSSNKYYVLDITLSLVKGDIEKAKYVATEWARRKRTQPRISCGSVWQSCSSEIKEELGLPTQAAGYVIDQKLGLKGYQIGGAQISEFHGNFIVNDSKLATAKDVLEIMSHTQKSAQELGISLVPEISFLGFSEDELSKFITLH